MCDVASKTLKRHHEKKTHQNRSNNNNNIHNALGIPLPLHQECGHNINSSNPNTNTEELEVND